MAKSICHFIPGARNVTSKEEWVKGQNIFSVDERKLVYAKNF
jgi:hypothetical protein